MYSLVQLIRKCSVDSPESSALIINDEPVAWLDLHRQIHAYVRELERLGPCRVIFHGDNSWQSIALLLATSRVPLGTICVSAYHSQARVDEFVPVFKPDYIIRLECGTLRILPTGVGRTDAIEDERSYLGLLTSGTTGFPKCAMHTWNSVSGAIHVSSRLTGGRWLLAYPFSHFAGMQVLLHSLLNRGCLVVPREFNPVSGREALERHAATYLSCTPTFMRQLLSAAGAGGGGTLRSVTLGGEAVDQRLLDTIKARFPGVRITQVYASTELGVSFEVRDEREGLPPEMIDGERFKIVDGELLIRRSERSMKGYLDAVAPVAEWCATSDLVRVTPDRVYFEGRKDSMINVGGFKVNPHQVEQVIGEIAGIEQVVVSGQKNALAGYLVRAHVVLAKDMTPANARAAIAAACSARLPYYMMPRLIDFIAAGENAVEVTGTYKLRRSA